MATPVLEGRPKKTKTREYAGPLGILAAGAIGISLLCSVSAMAMGDLNRYVPITLEPISIVGLAVSNFQTAAALTEQIVTVFVPTETLVPTRTDRPASLTPVPTDTQRRFVTITPTLPRRTRIPFTATTVPSRTPTATRRPPTATRTSTPVPPTATRTRTPIPPSETLTATDTPLPPPVDTDTPPPPTDTQPPPPVDTDTPLPDTPTSENPILVPSPTPGP